MDQFNDGELFNQNHILMDRLPCMPGPELDPIMEILWQCVCEIPMGLFIYIILVPISISALWVPPFRGRGVLFSSLILSLLYLAILNPPFPGDTNKSVSLALLWYLYFGNIEKVLFQTPESSYWRLGRRRQEALSMPPFSWEKFQWAASLSFNMRGVGWNWQVKGVPTSNVNEPRGHFLLKQARGLLVCFLCLDACSFYLRGNHFEDTSMSASGMSWERYLGTLAVMCVQGYFATDFQYLIFSIMAVGTGICEPKDWPPFLGEIRRATTLRYFWGGFWHQGLRKILTGYARFFVRVLHVPPHTPLSSILLLFFTFGLSGLYHGCTSYLIVPPTPASPYATTYDRFGRYLVFFLLQPVGIIAEDVALKVYNTQRRTATEEFPDGKKKSESTTWEALFGYCWVVSWMAFSGGFLVDTYLKTEMGLIGGKPSIVESLITYLQRWA